MHQTKGKQASRGQRQIYDENRNTIFYYSIASVSTSVLSLVLNIVVFAPNIGSWVGWTLTALTQLLAMGMMHFMVKNLRNEKNQVIDAGLDLNDPEAFGEYCKDAIILGCLTHALSPFSSYFYLILLAFPGVIALKLWNSIIYPWLTFNPQEGEDDGQPDKKQKRREKKVYIRR